ncbi:MAG: HD domain-containing protein [Chloroflexi bacterium]|nr:HD domain-containing protein [Chloroflexota bacterium]
MSAVPALPARIGGIDIPQDDVSEATWRWAHRSLPDYLFAHSVRAYCWGAAIGAGEGWAFEPRILWTSSLMHDIGLTRIPRNSMCFEVEGAEIARAFLVRNGMPAGDAEKAAIAIILHMRAGVGLDDGIESVLLDRATGLDVRGDGYSLVDAVRPEVVEAFPRGAFDRRFLAAIEREVAVRPGCQSARLLHTTGLAAEMARSRWSTAGTDGASPIGG